jgi:hypothetical protein
MLQRGLAYISVHNYPAGTNKAHEPAQTYLAYVYGSKDIEERRSAAEIAGKNGYCREKLFGVDCSGFVYQMALAASLSIDHGTSNQSEVLTWENALKNATFDASGLRPKKYTATQLPPNKLESGDFIYYKDAGGVIVHSGMVLKFADQLLIFQSNGSKNMNCPLNYSPSNRGPRVLTIGEINSAFNNRSWTIQERAERAITYAGAIRLELLEEVIVNAISPIIINGIVNEYLSSPVKVQVVDQDGKGVKGANINFAVKSGGGRVDQTTAVTDVDGYAETKWKLGNENGSQVLEVSGTKDGTAFK